MATGLQGTLTGQQVSTPAEAELEALKEELRRRAAEAQGQAGTAEQALLQGTREAQAPIPPGAFFVPALFGNIAAVLSQRPEFAERAQRNIEVQRADLRQRRIENLRALQGVFEQRARAAQEAGDLELRQKSLIAMDRMQQQEAKELEETRRRASKEETEIREAGAARRTAADQVQQLISNYVTAGQPVPEGLRRRAEKFGIIEPGTELPGARKPFMREVLQGQLPKGVSVLTANEYQLRLAEVMRLAGQKRVNKDAHRVKIRNFLSDARQMNEAPEVFVARLLAFEDPYRPGKRLFDSEQVRAARDRTYTSAELEVE